MNLLDQASSREPRRAGGGWILRDTAGDVVLSGTFDVSATAVLRAELLDAVSAAADVEVLTVDVREVTFLRRQHDPRASRGAGRRRRLRP